MGLRWLGHLVIVQEGRMWKHLLHGHILGLRKKGRSRNDVTGSGVGYGENDDYTLEMEGRVKLKTLKGL